MLTCCFQMLAFLAVLAVAAIVADIAVLLTVVLSLLVGLGTGTSGACFLGGGGGAIEADVSSPGRLTLFRTTMPINMWGRLDSKPGTCLLVNA